MQQDKELYRQAEKQKNIQQQTNTTAQQQSGYCSKCGASNEPEALYCEECGAALGGDTCPVCSSDLLPGADVCEKCGNYLNKERCWNCGEGLDEDDAFCQECGSPRGGVSCPQCHTHNHAAFCVKCYFPLTDLARLEIAKAQSEPAYQQAVSISAEIKALEQQLQLLNEEESVPEVVAPPVEVVEKPKTARQIERERRNEELKNMYLNLSGGIVQPPKEIEATETPVETAPPARKPLERKQNKADIEAIVNQKKQELQQLLDSMKPDESASPQMVRNYYTARKPPVSDSVWQCNFNKCYHPNPSHCGKPFLGGKWVVVYERIEWETHFGNM